MGAGEGEVAKLAMPVQKHRYQRRIVPPHPGLLPRKEELTRPTNHFPTGVHPEPARPELACPEPVERVERVEAWKDLKQPCHCEESDDVAINHQLKRPPRTTTTPPRHKTDFPTGVHPEPFEGWSDFIG